MEKSEPIRLEDQEEAGVQMLMEDIYARLQRFRTPRDFGWLLDHLDKLYESNERKLEQNKEYFKKNKRKIYDYHRKYRDKAKRNVKIST